MRLRSLSYFWIPRAPAGRWSLILVYWTFISVFLLSGSVGFPYSRPLRPLRKPVRSDLSHSYGYSYNNHAQPGQFRQYGFEDYDQHGGHDLYDLGQPHSPPAPAPHDHGPAPVFREPVDDYPPSLHFDPYHYASDDPAVLYQIEYSHATSLPPSHAPMFAHGPIARPGPPHHGAAPGASLPKLQLIHFMNPVPIPAKKFSYVHNLRRNKNVGLAPRPYPIGAHAPGFVQQINRLALRAYCAFNGMNAHCLQFYGEHEDWLGGEPYHNHRRGM